MGKFIAIPISFVVIVYGFFMMCTYIYARQDVSYLEKVYIEEITNYATDAAADILRDSSHLSADYMDFMNVTYDPDRAVQTFGEVFLMNLGIQFTDDTYSSVLSEYVPAIIVAGWDGYFIYRAATTPASFSNNGETMYVGSPKLPYTMKVGDDTVIVNMSRIAASEMPYTVAELDSSTGQYTYKQYDGFAKNPALGDLHGYTYAIDAINQTLAESMNKVVDDLNKDFDLNPTGRYSLSFNLPGLLGQSSNESTTLITAPTVLAYVDGSKISTFSDIAVLSIGGAEVDFNEPLGGFMYGGEKYYAKYSIIEGMSPIPDVIETFTSAYDAARLGYYDFVFK